MFINEGMGLGILYFFWFGIWVRFLDWIFSEVLEWEIDILGIFFLGEEEGVLDGKDKLGGGLDNIGLGMW